ncbi:ABC transporter permease [Halovulum sp. GXIMD14794]
MHDDGSTLVAADSGLTADPALNAEYRGTSLSYWQLVRRRFRRNAYGMAGMVVSLAILLTAVFAGFLAPYAPQTKDAAAIYSPPQKVRFFGENGLTRPHVLGFEEVMDDETFEITFQPSVGRRVDLALFVQGDSWQFLGLSFDRHLVGGADGQPVHFLGTDNLGRDVLSNMVHGTRLTLLMAFSVMGVACVIGTLMGVTSGYLGGAVDNLIQRFIEFVQSFPELPLYLALAAVLPRRAEPMQVFFMFAMILILFRWASLARELRGKVMSMRSLEYVRAAVAVGASDQRVILRHIVPNTTSHIIVWATYQLPHVILVESFLSFLGLGVQPPLVSWGSMLNQVRDFQSFSAAPWLMAPVGMIVLSVLAFNAFGDGLRDAMDPYSND